MKTKHGLYISLTSARFLAFSLFFESTIEKYSFEWILSYKLVFQELDLTNNRICMDNVPPSIWQVKPC